MRAFADGSADVLVATTVVEVGVDVPNATVMVIMDADRFGVSQLHQLRGRVGRGSEPGLCLLVTEAPEESKARQRLAEAVAATLDGFRLAEIDLEQRREGDVLGAAQAGRKKSLKLLSVLADEDLIVTARQEATDLVDADPDLAAHPALAAAIAARRSTRSRRIPGEGVMPGARPGSARLLRPSPLRPAPHPRAHSHRLPLAPHSPTSLRPPGLWSAAIDHTRMWSAANDHKRSRCGCARRPGAEAGMA